MISFRVKTMEGMPATCRMGPRAVHGLVEPDVQVPQLVAVQRFAKAELLWARDIWTRTVG